MYFNGASSKSITCYYSTGSNDKGNTTEVFQGQQINKFCLFVDLILTIEYFFFASNQILTCLYTGVASPLTDQVRSDIMNINERDVIILPGY